MTIAPDTRIADRRFNRILLIKPSSLGDVVHALPVLSGLRARFPDTHIAWLIARNFAPIIATHPDLNEVIEFDRHAMSRWFVSPTGFGALSRLVKHLRRQRFDLVIDLQGLFRSGFFARATGADVRIGFHRAREAAWMFYTHHIKPPTPDMHAVDKHWLVADMLGFADQPKRFNLGLTDEERRTAATLLADAGVAANERFVAVLPGARWDTKQWLAPRFVEVVDRLADQIGVRCALMGGPDEKPRCDQIAAAANSSPINLCGKTTIRTLIALIERSAAVLCHDSGPMHLAAALNRPMTAICGPTNPDRTGPYGFLESVLRVDIPCSPCYLRRMSQCRYDHRCMTEITAPQVTVRLSHALEAASRTSDI